MSSLFLHYAVARRWKKNDMVWCDHGYRYGVALLMVRSRTIYRQTKTPKTEMKFGDKLGINGGRNRPQRPAEEIPIRYYVRGRIPLTL